MRAKTARILADIDRDRISEASPSVILPLLQAAADESREQLQDLFAVLLANAMVDGGKRVRRDYFDAVRQMEPIDALVLNIISRRPNVHSDEKFAADADVQFMEHERSLVGMTRDDQDIAVSKLMKLDCVFVRQPIIAAGAVVQVPSQPREYPPSLTPFGRGLLAACKPPR